MLKTKVDEKLFGGRAKVEKELVTGSVSGPRYVYLLSHNGKQYILKGFTLVLILPIADQPATSAGFAIFLEQLDMIYQEFYCTKITSKLSQHFAKPLQLDTAVDETTPETASTFVHVEFILEYGGVTLQDLGSWSWESMYNLMRQSATALTVLQNIGMTHLDIKPTNMVYDASNNLLKIIDMGNFTAYTTTTKLHDKVDSVEGRIRSLTWEYAPPEIIRDACDVEFIIGQIDVYCWAMSFYSLLLNKPPLMLQSEYMAYKRSTEAIYAEFIDRMKLSLDKLAVPNASSQKFKQVIVQLLTSALDYHPDRRPQMKTIVQNMIEFENSQSVSFPYLQREENEQTRILHKLVLNQTASSAKEPEATDGLARKIAELTAEVRLQEETNRKLKAEFECQYAEMAREIEEHQKRKAQLEDAIQKRTAENIALVDNHDRIAKELAEKHSKRVIEMQDCEQILRALTQEKAKLEQAKASLTFDIQKTQRDQAAIRSKGATADTTSRNCQACGNATDINI